MKKKSGFTLTELLAVISILGLVMVVMIPYVLNAYQNAKTKAKENYKELLVDAMKLYLEDYDSCVKEYKISNDITIRDNNYKSGDFLSCYDFKVYASENDITVTAKDLIDDGYFDSKCYKENEEDKYKECKVTNVSECQVTGRIKTSNAKDPYTHKDTKYLVTESYEVDEINTSCTFK